MNQVRWGLIGAGDIVRKRVAPALLSLENSRLAAVCRGRADLAEEFAAEFRIEKAYPGVEEMLADSYIDAVYIASPVGLHRRQALAAAAAGKHVLCEKPLALDVAQCDEIIRACEFHGVTLGVAYYRRFYPLLRRVRELIESGAIGRVAVAQMNAFEYFDPPEGHPRRWLLDPRRSGGGPMMDFGCHRIEVLATLFGRVDEIASTVSDAVFGRDVEDTAVATLRFASGVAATVTVTHAALEPKDTLDVYGTKGSLHVAKVNGAELRIVDENGERSELHPPHDNVHLPLIDDFADAVVNRRPPEVTGADGREVNRIIEEIYGN